ncbi:MAG: ammonium transporter [Saccharofermentans sp.]|jgi:Amt family ammonium transporter|nr:ammonium transporter [Mageeibacillus sp.]MCI1264234.1 ammonium transporter [Saccharofermentans sp.]MCI1274969.1 ammonium transporter [Saccharofermentans sp.]MCI1770017.1 ammonium transporter [Mageeibacillus sp.]MCI2044255.1 ammonium transporter [Mageeibacillus sp.]
MDINQISDMITSEAFGIWYLIGAALVFFMQAGFAMVESGFTRAKNAGNIIMKNLMDFCIGTPCFMILGFGLMMSENYVFGLIGVPNMQMFTDFSGFMEANASSFVFNLVFCATAATIVSGAMAERTKFLSYCIYSAVISLVVYPIEAGWTWNSQGWLAKLGFIDFAGSACIHTVGGVAALIGAAMLGPRIGKYVKNASGKVVKVNAILGHNLVIGALGCFILWFGWYGFNGAAATSGPQLAAIFLTTTIAPAVATVTCMIFTWLKNGKPDVSMCLNASLAGLVGITAGCHTLDAIGATIVGIVSGIIVVLVVEKLDTKFHIDDPVGAVGVHLANGIWGTLAAGLLSTSKASAGVDGPIYALVNGTDFLAGLKVFGVQILGITCIIAWTTVTMLITFTIIEKTVGLRVSREEEIEGLDATEHGLPTAFAGFAMRPQAIVEGDDAPVAVTGSIPAAEAVEIKSVPVFDENHADGPRFTKIEIVCKEARLDALKNAMMKIGITGMTVSHVLGCGVQKGRQEYYRGVPVEASLLPKVQVDIVVSKVPVQDVVDAARKTLYTGHIGDGKIFVYNVLDIMKVRTGETGFAALQDTAD